MPVSIWSNIVDGEYADRIITETPNTMIVKYFGQPSGRDDHLIGPDAYFFYKNGNKDYYNYGGKILAVSQMTSENNMKVYELVVQKHTSELQFRIKNDACTNFGWALLNRFQVMSGIISH